MSNTVTRDIVATTNKGKGTEVTVSAAYVAPSTMDECVSALRGEDKLVEFVADVLTNKAFAAGKARLYNYALEGEADTQAARNKALAGAVESVRDYTYSARGEGVAKLADAARAAREIAQKGGTLEEIRAALGL